MTVLWNGLTVADPVISEQIPKRTVIAINGSGGAFVLVTPTSMARYCEIVECAPNGGTFNGANYLPQGLNYTNGDDGYVAEFGLLPGAILQIGDLSYRRDRAIGIPSGMKDPAGQSISAPVNSSYKLRSATATATQILLSEWA